MAIQWPKRNYYYLQQVPLGWLHTFQMVWHKKYFAMQTIKSCLNSRNAVASLAMGPHLTLYDTNPYPLLFLMMAHPVGTKHVAI